MFMFIGLICIVMELCNQKTLYHWLQDRNKNDDLHSHQGHVFRWFLQILAGLQHIHENDLIHRDLYPKNILFSNDKLQTQWEAKIGDFGLATNTPYLTHTAKQGNKLYASPEQHAMKKYNKTTDIYPLGIKNIVATDKITFLYSYCV